MLTPNQVAKRLQVGYRTVMAWIRSGELVVSNLAPSVDSMLPRWKVTEQAIQAFLDKRSRRIAAPPAKRRKLGDVIEFF